MDTISCCLLGAWLGFIALDLTIPARRFPRVAHWRPRGLAFFVVSIGLSITLPFVWDGWLGERTLVDASGLGTWGGAVAGLLMYEFLLYWWHRALHKVGGLWRVHQLHHSAERVDIFGAYYFHPLDAAGFSLVASVSLVFVLGVSAEAAALAGAAATFLALFQHANIRTPRWLGYFVQRPEQHSVHHQRGHHRSNYSDLPVFDLLFGTFENPRVWDGEAGFWHGASGRVGAMLLGQDVSEPQAAVERTLPALESAPLSRP